MGQMKKSIPLLLARTIRWGLSVIFVYAGMAKLFDTKSFAIVIAGYGLLPNELVYPFAVALPLLEVISAAGLICRVRGSLTVILFQLLFFIGILSYGIWLGLDVDCGCFGPDDPEQAYKSLRVALLRDLLMVGGVLYLYWCDWQKKKGGKGCFPKSNNTTEGDYAFREKGNSSSSVGDGNIEFFFSSFCLRHK